MARGHCLCGAVTFTTQGEPRWIAYCHCASCRRHAASPVTAFVNFKRASVSFAGAPATYGSSPGVTRSFCRTCGSPIAYETERRSDEIDLYLNVFDQPERFTPTGHAYYEEHLPWFDTRDELPRK